jgi:PKD repeat protein
MKKLATIILCTLLSGALQSQNHIQTPMPSQTGTFSANARGYWFVAPTCFTITAAMVPTDANGGNQNIAIIRLETTPPTFSATTNNFDVLYITQNNSDLDTLGGLNIIINQGDIIGVLGSRSDIASYSNTGNTTTIDGIPTALTRLGMQFPLSSTPPQQIWTEAASNIGRVFLYYDTTMFYNITHTNIGADYSFADATDTLYTALYSIWNYGDGSPLDTNYNPTHTYAANGDYTVCSYVQTSCGIDTVCTSVTVCAYTPTAGFSSNSTGMDVTFTNTSTNAQSWLWDFGDGDTSTLQNPSHTFGSPGWYTITLIATNPCSANDTLTDSVLVCVDPMAGVFTTSNLNSPTVSFIDGSSNATNWNWDFGDGDTSTTQNPAHNYLTNGNYTVCLIAGNLCGADTVCSSITVCPSDPTANFTHTSAVFSAIFTNSSTLAISSLWNFGDGNSSTTSNPNHTYALAGTYWVCLTSYDECGDSAVFCDSVSIAGNVGINEIPDTYYMNASPNPTNGFANIGLNSPENIYGKLYITDMTGKVVSTIYTGMFASGASQYGIHTTVWKEGIYLLVWETNQWKISRKLILN